MSKICWGHEAGLAAGHDCPGDGQRPISWGVCPVSEPGSDEDWLWLARLVLGGRQPLSGRSATQEEAIRHALAAAEALAGEEGAVVIRHDRLAELQRRADGLRGRRTSRDRPRGRALGHMKTSAGKRLTITDTIPGGVMVHHDRRRVPVPGAVMGETVEHPELGPLRWLMPGER